MWQETFDNTRRHCWEGASGVRYLEIKTHGDECNVDHSDNPKVVGTVEWMRFIYAVRDLGVNVSDVNLSRIGNEIGVETYPDFKVYLNHNHGTAVIECTNADLDETFEAAYEKVQESYNV